MQGGGEVFDKGCYGSEHDCRDVPESSKPKNKGNL